MCTSSRRANVGTFRYPHSFSGSSYPHLLNSDAAKPLVSTFPIERPRRTSECLDPGPDGICRRIFKCLNTAPDLDTASKGGEAHQRWSPISDANRPRKVYMYFLEKGKGRDTSIPSSRDVLSRCQPPCYSLPRPQIATRRVTGKPEA